MYEPLSFGQWQEQLHTPFTIRFQDGTALTLTLDQVEDLGSTPRQEQFALRFVTTHSLPQATYILEHERLGQKAIFLVPIAREGQFIRYEASFNRLVEA